MTFVTPPLVAAWRHQQAREGFEVVFFDATSSRVRIEGHTSAVEDGAAWAVRYEIDLAADWSTRNAHVFGQSTDGHREATIESVGSGQWLVNGERAPHLDGCFDVDLESSALTNAFPVHRLALPVGDKAPAPAVYIRAADLNVGRLEQQYVRVADLSGGQNYDYAAPVFNFECRLVYDEFGLVTTYPGLAARVR